MEKLKKYVLGILEKVPLEDSDIKEILGNDQRILKYNQLSNYNNIEDLLPYEGSNVILLYEQEENSGHWCCIKRMGNTLYYFNSYGGQIDDPLNWSKENNEMLGQGKPFLKIMLNKTPMDCYYNLYDFQSKKNYDISTCGLWCIAFLTSGLTLHQFYDYIMKLKKKTKLPNDKLITEYVINNIIN